MSRLESYTALHNYSGDLGSRTLAAKYPFMLTSCVIDKLTDFEDVYRRLSRVDLAV